jgi:ATP-dependent helicase/nuclease subunit B
MAIRTRVFSIHPGLPFLSTLVTALLDGQLVDGFRPRGDALALASATIFLPTRRAIRTIREVFLDALGGNAAILPRLLALGEVDDEEAAVDPTPGEEVLLDAVGALERQIELTRCVLDWARGKTTALLPLPGGTEPLMIPASPGDAARLATALARFMDGLENERVGFDRLRDLRAEHEGRYDRYFDITLEFLEIATQRWPAYLSDRSLMDPVARRNRLLEAEARRLAAGLQGGPVIVAGSTGSIPATRDLIAAAARHPQGAVILPGLDKVLDQADWSAIPTSTEAGAPTHPQAGLYALLSAMALAREDVRDLGEVTQVKAARAALLSRALRPARTTDAWSSEGVPATDAFAEALSGVTVVEAATEAEEALAIAVVMRAVLERDGARAALVTPDRQMAARVVTELARWGIAADDSAGRPLSSSPPGILVRLVLDAALDDLATVPLLALLKDPLCTLSIGRAAVVAGTAAIEFAALRGPAPPPGLKGLRQALMLARDEPDPYAPRARKALQVADFAAAERLLDAISTALSPLIEALHRPGTVPAATLFAAHAAAARASADPAGFATGDAGESMATFLDDLLRVRPEALDLPPSAYPGLFAALIAGRSARGGDPSHPRLAIYGLLEARLIPVDRLILGGLDEGLWPGTVEADPWLNRPMRAALGLTEPERRIGLAAHDFTQGLGADDVVITRALKRGGSPTVPARWLQRLAAYGGREGYAQLVARGQVWLDHARALDAPARAVQPISAPEPRPPRDRRPTSLSVTEIEHLLRDPYTIYARHVLKLDPLDGLALPPSAADRGTMIHAGADRFAVLVADGIPADAQARLDDLFRDLLAPIADYPDIAVFLKPRLRRISRFLVRWETRRRPTLKSVVTEVRGRLGWSTVAGRRFELRAKADRIERLPDGRARIVDFKTGVVPSIEQVKAALAPQLPLEAAMVLEGGFPTLGPVTGLVESLYVALTGKADGGREQTIAFKDIATEDHARQVLDSLKTLIDRFEDETTPYRSMLHPMFKGRRYGDYDHLARVREWSLSGEGEGDEP